MDTTNADLLARWKRESGLEPCGDFDDALLHLPRCGRDDSERHNILLDDQLRLTGRCQLVGNVALAGWCFVGRRGPRIVGT
jgi:hypothetical protein